MKLTRFSVLTCSILLTLFLSSAFANHRTGSFALPELLVAGDFNRDGVLDLAVHLTGFDMVGIFLGDGNGGFTLNGHIRLDTLPKGLATADINRDGKLDLVNCNNWGYNVKVLLGDGSGGFNTTKELNGDGEPVRLILRDFNKDDRLDIAVNAPNEGSILIYFGDGKGGFVTPAEELEDVTGPFGLAAGDFDRDTNLDIATTSSPGINAELGQVAIFKGDGAGNFIKNTEFDTKQLATSLQTGDMNKDGLPDLIVAGAQPRNTQGNFISTLLGDGAGNFTLKQTLELGAGNLKGEIAVGDYDEDGDLDVAFPQTGLNSDLHIHSQNLLLFFGDGTGKLAQGPTHIVGKEPHTVITADFNKDGHLDLAITNRTDGTVSVLLGNGNGGFAETTTFAVDKATP